MKRLLLTTLPALTLSTLTLSTIAVSPASAERRVDRSITSTSNALPLLEAVRIQGRVIGIEGNRVQIAQPFGETGTYRISEPRQQQFGIQVGSNITLSIRRLNSAVVAINEVQKLDQQQAATHPSSSAERAN